MSFFEDIASALDAEGIESRVYDETMFVPITSDLEIQFVEIDQLLPAANVYIAAADVDVDDEDFEATLVSVVFSVEAAVKTVADHVATDQMVTVLHDLLDGTDERIAELEFYQDALHPTQVRAEVTERSELKVECEVVDGSPTAHVTFVVYPEDSDEAEETLAELWDEGTFRGLSEEERLRLAARLELAAQAETLELGSFDDFDRLFDVLSLVTDYATTWQEQLDPVDEGFDEPEVYDLFGLDDDDDDYEDDEDYDDEDEDEDEGDER